MARRNGYHLWTPDEIEYVRTLSAQGATAPEIARLMGMSVPQIANARQTYGIPFVPRQLVPTTPTLTVPAAPAPAPPVLDPVERAQRAREHAKALKDERQALEAVAGERSLRAHLDALFRDVVPRIDPPPKYKATKAKAGAVEETALFQWSDWHYGEVVEAERVREYNAYSPAIAAQRVRSMVHNGRSILERLRTGGYRFGRAVVAANGDLVTGTIHELEKYGDGKVITQHVADCGYLLAEAIRDVAADFAQVDVFCTVGNHGRLPDARRMEQKGPLRNWDALVYMFAQCALRDVPNVRVQIPDAYALGYDIDGWAFIQQHGHDIKSWSGIPFYGIQRYTSRIVALEASRDRAANYFLFGHFHTATSLPQAAGELFVNGSLIGATEYGVNALGVADRPTQWLVGVHPEHGVTHRWPVFPDVAVAKKGRTPA